MKQSIVEAVERTIAALDKRIDAMKEECAPECSKCAIERLDLERTRNGWTEFLKDKP